MSATYAELQRYLRHAGARVPRGAIAGWSPVQRREAYRWALTQIDACPGCFTSAPWPDHVRAAAMGAAA